MKHVKHTIALMLTLILLAACGKDGAQGPAGQQGAPGANGKDAELPAYAVTQIIDPCGDAPSVVDEVLLKMANGQFLVSFSENASGKNTRLAVLPAGTYITTDGSNCTFTITAGGNVTW